MLYVFCKKRRQADMRACLGLLAERFGFTLELEEFDTGINKSHDVTNLALGGSIMKKIKRFYDVVLMPPPRAALGPECASQTATDHDLAEIVEGLGGSPWMERRRWKKLEAGNQLVGQIIEGCVAAYQAAAFFIIVHPEDLGHNKNDNVPASIWQRPIMRSLVTDSAAMTFAVFQCIYDAPTSKPEGSSPTSRRPSAWSTRAGQSSTCAGSTKAHSLRNALTVLMTRSSLAGSPVGPSIQQPPQTIQARCAGSWL